MIKTVEGPPIKWHPLLLFIYPFIFGCTLGLPGCMWFSLTTTSRDYSLVAVSCLLLLRSTALGAQTSVVQLSDLASLRHVGSSRPRDQTHVPCVKRKILYHWTTQEVPSATVFECCTVSLFQWYNGDMLLGLPRWLSGREYACQCRRGRRLGFDPGLGRYPVVGNGSLLPYSCLKNSMDRGAWRATVRGVAESDRTERTCTQY